MVFSSRDRNNNTMLWYKQPANEWVQALPVGNGRLGCMYFGAETYDRLALNEESIWAGKTMDSTNQRSAQALPKVRQLLFEGENQKAEALAITDMLAVPLSIQSYQPLCDVWLSFDGVADISDYIRYLDLAEGITAMEYTRQGIRYRREVFCSAVDQVICVHLACEKGGMLSLGIALSREENACTMSISNNSLLMSGQCGPDGVKFESCLLAVPKGGSIHAEGNTLFVQGADEVTLYICAATSYRAELFSGNTSVCCNSVALKSYENVLADHSAEHGRLFGTMDIDLGTSTNSALPMEDRLAAFRNGGNDPELFSLYFQYVRYLLLASSRPGCLPSNLQGIWNDMLEAPWNSDYHANINLQMNYWPAEVCNLSACHEPLFDWMDSLLESGTYTAARHYHARGWVLHHVSDIWGSTTPRDGLCGLWPFGAAWLCRHLYEHYLFSLDRRFLRLQAYPIMAQAARFVLDFLVEVPCGVAGEGYLVASPSHSPENRFIDSQGNVCWFTYGVTMDFEIIRDLFTNCLATIAVFCDEQNQFDSSLKTELEQALAKLPPLLISKKTNGIQEWLQDYDEYEPGHRHISHLYGVYPAGQITVEGTPELARAAIHSIDRRFAHQYDGQGWSLGWLACILARLKQADRSYGILQDILKKKIYPNLFINAHGNPQVGDAGGVAAAIAEMLLQSHEGVLYLLPALPTAWPCGHIIGLRARGAFEVDIHWEDMLLSKAVIRSLKGGQCTLRTSVPLVIAGIANSSSENQGSYYLLELNTIAGGEYSCIT